MRLAEKYGLTAEAAGEELARLASVAAAEGLHLAFEWARPANTRDAHRLLHRR